jgi:peptide-methionine (S)-S-oxide reductase
MTRTIAAFLFFLIVPATGWSSTAVFAGGCFWCMESAYQDVPGVTGVVSGFSGGSHPNPTYKGAHDGHYEVVEVSYDPAEISFGELLQIYWVNVDPFDAGGQFCDRGESYRTAIFVADEMERELAAASKAEVETLFPGQQVVTPILSRAKFFPVDEYHQDYYLKNPMRYKYYRWNCGRDQRLADIWSETELKTRAAALALEKH